MDKELIEKQALVDAINEHLKSQWSHEKTYCKVESIREAHTGNCNWMVDMTSTGGITLEHANECRELQNKVLEDFAEKYNVDWTA
ncbi:MAG: hypothetical protein KME68_20365 [Candidatus Thiodiazotropha sp. (ex Lucina pensylvanica)]|nr:hypothetical protein [Candidatus Thiodiazotropha sp. (ex Lucina pensylvanica)]